ncbi:ubiquitin carboxyl-terminal hydrolase L5, partial [Tremellales sp. Uapishka_1]
MSDDPSGWSLTESDPQVFTELLRSLGVKGLQVDDLYSLDASTLDTLKPIHALIFLFKYVGDKEGEVKDGIEVDPLQSGVWFANQVINNSCGTLAALNAVMNIPTVTSEEPGEAIELGTELENLRDFGAGMESMDLGHILSSSETIRDVHNSFSKSSPFAIDSSLYPEREKEDAYHFVTYLPVNGVIYELDGLRRMPLMHSALEDKEDWLEKARETIENRIATYPPGSLMFNLLCIRSAAIPRLTRLLKDPELGTGRQMLLSDQLEHEKTKTERGELENALRRHNLLPAVFELFKVLGESGSLDTALEGAREKAKMRAEKKKATGMEED